MSKVADIASAIVFLALISVMVRSTNTASVITAFGNVFTGSIKAAEG